ncbi:MAG: hypothetical protein CMH64_03260 [Nanoarchaeota archaeon]|nr:hypothetical protein [Nanoarchaeota archaeon]|tara:strand:+ start:1134 stop:1400 length:267 start_codon:yes stop_codon:yes gene_type:complete
MNYWPEPYECVLEVRDWRFENGDLPGCQHYDLSVALGNCEEGEWCKNGWCEYPNQLLLQIINSVEGVSSDLPSLEEELSFDEINRLVE